MYPVAAALGSGKVFFGFSILLGCLPQAVLLISFGEIEFSKTQRQRVYIVKFITITAQEVTFRTKADVYHHPSKLYSYNLGSAQKLLDISTHYCIIIFRAGSLGIVIFDIKFELCDLPFSRNQLNRIPHFPLILLLKCVI